MENIDLYVKNLTGKDEAKAKEAASYLMNSGDKEMFKILTEKSDFLFDFVINNVCKRIENAVNEDNFGNIINLFEYYSPYYDDLFADILSRNANEDLTDKIFDLLEKGTVAQKTYAAKYFSYIPDTVALELLSKYAFCDNDALACNSAEALSQMQDDTSYNIALGYLRSNDDFDKLKAVKYFVSYGRDYPLKEIFEAMKSSKIPENIAGQIPYAESLKSLLKSNYKYDSLTALVHILTGFGEILPLCDIFKFELYEILETLISENNDKNENSGIIALIILTAYSKFALLCDNPEYMYDEDKNTKNEIIAVYNLLKAQNTEFLEKQKEYIAQELTQTSNTVFLALNQIKEHNITTCTDKIKELLNSDNEGIICEALMTLKHLNALEGTDIKALIQKITNPNIKAVMENIDG